MNNHFFMQLRCFRVQKLKSEIKHTKFKPVYLISN